MNVEIKWQMEMFLAYLQIDIYLEIIIIFINKTPCLLVNMQCLLTCYSLNNYYFNLYGRYFLLFFNSHMQVESGDEELCGVYVPMNHLYIGEIFLVNCEYIIRPNLSVREIIGW